MFHTKQQNISPPATPSPQMPQRNITQIYTNSTMNQSPPVSPSPPPPTDIIGNIIANFGIWQLRTVLIIFLCKIPASWFMACIIFTAPELQAPSEFACDSSALNENQSISSDQCYVLEQTQIDGSAGGAIVARQECTNFLYNYDFQSLIMEFDLVCLRDIFVAWTQYWHLFGVLLGGVAGTKMMLSISPRNVYAFGMVTQIVCGCVTGFARDFTLHCIFRCLSAVCCAIMFTSGQAIIVDITAGVYRTATIILYDTFWSIGVIILPGLSYFFNHWTYIYLGITFPTLILILLLKWTPESPRWLLKNGHKRDIDRVEEIIREAAEINDRTFKIPSDFRQQLVELRETLKSQPVPAGWLQLWRGHRAKINMVATHLALAAYIINYMGMLLNIRSFGRDYLVPNTIAMGVSEIVGCFLALHFTLKHDQWKWQWAGGFNILAGVIGCLGWFFSGANSMDPGLKATLWMIIALIPKAAVSCAQSMILACMAELMPPNKKIPFVFSVVTWARIWLLTAPFVNVLKKVDVALSLSAYCILSIFGGVFTCLLLTPRPATETMQSNKKEQSPLTAAVWTVEDDVHNTRL